MTDERIGTEVAGFRIWLADGSDRTVTRIEPATRQPRMFDVPGEVPYVTVDEETGQVWALSVPEA